MSDIFLGTRPTASRTLQGPTWTSTGTPDSCNKCSRNTGHTRVAAHCARPDTQPSMAVHCIASVNMLRAAQHARTTPARHYTRSAVRDMRCDNTRAVPLQACCASTDARHTAGIVRPAQHASCGAQAAAAQARSTREQLLPNTAGPRSRGLTRQ